MAFFIHRVLRGEQTLDTVERESLRIGRGTDADLRLDDHGVELVHAELTRAPDGTLTLHNKAHVGATSIAGDWLERDGTHDLVDGDRIEVGPFEIRVDLVPGSGTDPGPPPVLHVLRLDEDRDLAESGSYTSFRASTKTLLALAEREMARQATATTSDAEATREITARTVLGKLPPPDPHEAKTLIGRFVPPPPPPPPDSHWAAAPPPPPPKAIEPAPASLPTSSATEPPASPPSSMSSASSEAVAELPLRTAADPARPSRPQSTTPAAGDSSTRRGPRAAPRRVPYLAAYRLPTSRAQALLALGLVVVVATVAVGLVLRGDVGETFSPGPMGGAHTAVVFEGCSSCHVGFLGVRDSRCQECHRTTAPHQDALVALAGVASGPSRGGEPACIHCHTEHRGGDALRLADEGVCVDCHGALDARVPGSMFANRITHFAVDHPELAVYAQDGSRLRLDEPGARDADPGGLRGFDHRWHIARLPGDLVLDCADCHRLDAAREIVPLTFEESCQRCHQLAFDPRFGTLQAPHAEPVAVADFLAGRYVRSRDVLARLSGPERRALGSGSLSREQQLTRVASLVGRRLARNQCARCHHLELAADARSDSFTLDQITVRPVRITETWFPHARFSHAPHLDLMACSDCHGLVRDSSETTDILMPSIETCRPCHAGEQEIAGPSRLDAERGRAACISCHAYHADPIELARSDEPSRGGPS
ncbi:MAG: cytochrome c3 family protein [Acidobacteriota bacterium]